MKRIFRQTFLAVVALGFAATALEAQAGSDNTGFGTTSAEFMMLGAGARGTALGGSFAALADDSVRTTRAAHSECNIRAEWARDDIHALR